MNCVARFTQEDLKRRKSPDISLGSTDAEKQIHSTDLDINSVRTFETVLEDEHQISQETSPVRYSGWNLGEGKRPLFLDTKVGPTTAYFFFTRNKSRCMSPNSPMKRSKKSTNLVKYRNFIEEPTLKRPLSKCMLLGKYKMKVSKKSDPEKSADRGITCDAVEKESNEVQVTIIDSKSLQDSMTTSDFDNITDKLMISIFQNAKNTRATEAKFYIRQVIKDLYDAKFHEVHPVKALFRSLLEYWLKNTNVEPVKHAMKRSRSIARQSNRFFTRDKNLSSVYISNVTKQTQFHGLSEMLVQYKKKPKMSQDEKKAPPPKCPSPRRDTESYEKERRIQELERLLKNTVYMCETTRSKERDIKITKTLMGNLGKLSRKSELDESAEFKIDNSNSSTEKIQDTLNHLISETAIPADVAKELLGAYLDVLLKDDARSLTSTSSQSSEHSGGPKASQELSCEVQTEAIVKRVSKSVSTLKPADPKKEKSTEVMKPVDPGQLYLKEILDKITTIFSRVRKLDEKCRNNEKSSGDIKPSNFKKEESKDELGRSVKEYPGKNLIYENFDENSVVIGLSKYDLEHISMFSDPAIQGIMSITIKLKEKPTIAESKLAHLSLQFAESQNLKKQVKRECPMKENWLEYMQPANTNSNEIFRKKVKVAENAFIDFPQELDLKPYTSSSDATSKAYKVVHESEHSIDLSFKSSASIVKDTNAKQSFENEGTQSCYIMSFKKDSLATKFQSKKKVRLKDCNGICLDTNVLPPTKQAELSVFENPTPRVIDEKFILLLLENLTLLSKNIPSLHKEINNLFLKLRKKHEKILKSCSNMQGLSLLGKIYNEESVARVSRDAMTQWDVCGTPGVSSNVTHETAVNTATSNVKEKLQLNVRDANISAIDLKLMMNSQVQTMSNSEELILKFQRERPLGDTSLSIARSDSAYSIKAEMERAAKRTTSNSKLQFKKICVLSPTLASMIDVDAHNILIHPQILKEHAIKKKKHSSRLKQDLIKEIALLSPSFKVSTQSQTDRKLLRFVTEQAIEKDYKMYQLYQSYNVTMASSLTDSNVEINPSDEMKTLYRCSSDPSCSG
ncbi:uncharacterized protein LOC124641212 [Helicoverpa zea]|uniref:uncharacterized protein LOC124641212 n=1 Tax=Helicoverpa zea TaxID=7113 RepID=UPI001F580690|nr:uncharacterized protein LOC124641212 [Helicoverpa zea]